MRTKEEVKLRFERALAYQQETEDVNKMYLQDKNRENREKAIKSVAENEAEIKVLKWVLDKGLLKDELRDLSYELSSFKTHIDLIIERIFR